VTGFGRSESMGVVALGSSGAEEGAVEVASGTEFGCDTVVRIDRPGATKAPRLARLRTDALTALAEERIGSTSRVRGAPEPGATEV
jgi:hypothetical protein